MGEAFIEASKIELGLDVTTAEKSRLIALFKEGRMEKYAIVLHDSTLALKAHIQSIVERDENVVSVVLILHERPRLIGRMKPSRSSER